MISYRILFSCRNFCNLVLQHLYKTWALNMAKLRIQYLSKRRTKRKQSRTKIHNHQLPESLHKLVHVCKSKNRSLDLVDYLLHSESSGAEGDLLLLRFNGERLWSALQQIAHKPLKRRQRRLSISHSTFVHNHPLTKTN